MLLQTAHVPETELLQVQRIRQAGDEAGRIRHGGLMVVMLVQADERGRARVAARALFSRNAAVQADRPPACRPKPR